MTQKNHASSKNILTSSQAFKALDWLRMKKASYIEHPVFKEDLAREATQALGFKVTYQNLRSIMKAADLLVRIKPNRTPSSYKHKYTSPQKLLILAQAVKSLYEDLGKDWDEEFADLLVHLEKRASTPPRSSGDSDLE